MDWQWLGQILALLSCALAVTGLSERCNRSFKDSVERCMANIRDFPVLTRKKTLVIGQIERTKVICDYGLVNMSGICVATVYAQCPRVNQMKTDCDLQWLDPDFLLQYGHIICNNIHALEENLQCIEARTCNLEKCLMTFDPYVPSRLSTGIWKTPRYSADCGFHAFAEHCYNTHLFGHCSNSTDGVFIELLSAMRPDSCSLPQLAELRAFYDTHNPFSAGVSDHGCIQHRAVRAMMLVITVLAVLLQG